MVDVISDMLTRIRNANALSHPTVEIPFSKLKYEIAKILQREGLIESVDLKGRRQRREIVIFLKYKDKIPTISGLRRISKPGQRIYSGSAELRKFKKRGGILIVSTSRGLMTDRQAQRTNIGGEILCEVW